MPNTETPDAPPERAAFSGLEALVGRAIDRMAQETERADAAEAKSRELEELLRRFTGDEAEAGRLLTRLKTLEAENADLKERLATGLSGVDRMLAKIRFLETQR